MACLGDGLWVPVCSAVELPSPGATRSCLLGAECLGPRSRALPLAIVRGKDGQLFVSEDVLPPLGQAIAGPHAAVDGRLLRVTCRGLGTHFSLETGDVMGTWCPGPWGTYLSGLFLWGPVLTLLLALAARLYRCTPGLRRPQRLRLFRSRLLENHLEIWLPGREDAAHRGVLGPLLRAALLPQRPPRPLGDALEVEVRESRPGQGNGGDETVELKLVALDRAKAWPLMRLRPAFEAGWLVVRLPDPRMDPHGTALVSQVLATQDAKPVGFAASRRVAVWISQFVEPAARGCGVDRVLESKMLDVLHTRGYGYLLFTVDYRGPKLYAKLRDSYLSQGCLPVPEGNPLGVQRGMLRAVRTPTLQPMPNTLTAAATAVDGATATWEAAMEAKGSDLASNAFVLIHGYVAVPLLLELVASVLPHLRRLGSTSLADLAVASGAHAGPLAVLLRAAAVLNFVERDAATLEYRHRPSPAFAALEELLLHEGGLACELRRLYQEAQPPFRMDSDAARLLLEAWATQRPKWQSEATASPTASASRLGAPLKALLDGAVLAPLLTSLVYFHRWDEEGLDHGRDSMEHISCGALDATAARTLDALLREIGVGRCEGGAVQTTPAGALALQRTYTFFVGTSYCPLLAHFRRVLLESPDWGFAASGAPVDEAQDGTEVHVSRTLNVVGSGAQHRSLFQDLSELLRPVFSTKDFASQPAFIVDMGCGDGALLAQLYAFVREKTQRGQALSEHPLTMIGADLSERSRIAAAVNLTAKGVPHRVLTGDIGDPVSLCTTLTGLGATAERVLHVRSFLDHDRPLLAAQQQVAEDSHRAEFIRQEFADATYLDQRGAPVAPVEIYQSLVEHFQRWGNAVGGSHGICMLEVMSLDVLSTRRYFNDNVSFHFDIESSLSRQYLVPPTAFCMALVEAGLFCQDYQHVRAYPESSDYCRILSHHLVKRPFRARLAERGDIDELARLEKASTPQQELQVGRGVICRRLQLSPCGTLVVEGASGLLAALYTTRIASEDEANAEIVASPLGSTVQLVGLHADPAAQGMGLGSLLRDLALHLARVDPRVRGVCGVSRCGGYRDRDRASPSAARAGAQTHEAYVAAHRAGEVADRILSFHTSRGADVIRVLPGARPRDVDNGGAGVLIRYDLRGLQATRVAGAAARASAVAASQVSDLLREVFDELGYDADAAALPAGGLAELGLDSLELERLRSRLGNRFGVEIQLATLLACQSVVSIAQSIQQLGGSTAPLARISGATAVAAALEELGFDVCAGGSEEDGFAALGLDSINLVQLRDDLAVRLGLELPTSLCLDYPSASALAAQLDAIRART